MAETLVDWAVMDVRPARPGEGEALLTIHARAWLDAYESVGDAEIVAARLSKVRDRDWEDVISRRRESGSGVLALVDEARLVGRCEFGPTVDADDDPRVTGHVFRLFVDPVRQRRGGGRLLVDAARAHLLEAQMKEATLWVLESDARARGFYEHLGWLHDGSRQGEPVADIRYRSAVCVICVPPIEDWADTGERPG